LEALSVMTRRAMLTLASIIPWLPGLALSQEKPAPGGKPFVPTSQYETRFVEGWTVRVNKALLTDQADLGKRALRLLELKLFDVSNVVPAKACSELRKVPIWLGVNDGHAPCSEYHPSETWLRENGFNPDKARGVEIGNAKLFLEWSQGQPSMVLHELAHAYHDRVLGFGHQEIARAYAAAVESKIYDSVLRNNGKLERAYAMSNAQEYFAESSESFFGTNDFYPFVAAELRQHDPRMYELLRTLWSK
jgi:hypothetical protein